MIVLAQTPIQLHSKGPVTVSLQPDYDRSIQLSTGTLEATQLCKLSCRHKKLFVYCTGRAITIISLAPSLPFLFKRTHSGVVRHSNALSLSLCHSLSCWQHSLQADIKCRFVACRNTHVLRLIFCRHGVIYTQSLQELLLEDDVTKPKTQQ